MADFLLLEDGTSKLLLEDGTSFLLLESSGGGGGLVPVVSGSFTGETTGVHPAGFTDLSDGFGQVQVNSEQFGTPYGFDADSISNATFDNDQYFEWEISALGTGANGDVLGVLLRFANTVGAGRDGYRVKLTQTNTATFTITIEVVVDATPTTLATDTTISFALTDRFGGRVIGNQLQATKNGTVVLSTTDSTYSTGKPGLHAKAGALATFKGDNFEGGNIVAGSTIAVGQATETDTAQAVIRAKVRAVGQVTETDTAQAITRFVADQVNQATETNTAQAIARAKARLLGQATEADTTQAIAGVLVPPVSVVNARHVNRVASSRERPGRGPFSVGRFYVEDRRYFGSPALGPLTYAVGQAVEADTAQTIARAKRQAAGQATETDAAQLTTEAKARSVAQATETGTAQALTHAKARGVALTSEADSALAASHAKQRSVSQVSESDTALPAVVVGAVQSPVNNRLANRTASGRIRPGRSPFSVGRFYVKDSRWFGPAPSQALVVAVGLATEADLAQSASRRKSRSTGQAVEADSAQGITEPGSHVVPVGQATEADTASGVVRNPTARLIALAQEAGALFAVGHAKSRLVGQVSESDTALGTGLQLRRLVGTAFEANTSQPISVLGGVAPVVTDQFGQGVARRFRPLREAWAPAAPQELFIETFPAYAAGNVAGWAVAVELDMEVTTAVAPAVGVESGLAPAKLFSLRASVAKTQGAGGATCPAPVVVLNMDTRRARGSGGACAGVVPQLLWVEAARPPTARGVKNPTDMELVRLIQAARRANGAPVRLAKGP